MGRRRRRWTSLRRPSSKWKGCSCLIPQFIEGAQHDLEEAGQLLLAEEGGGASGAVLLVWRDLQELVAEAFGGFTFGRECGDFCDEGVAQVADALAGELRGGSCLRRGAGWRR